MKIASTLLIVALFLIGTGCEQKSTPQDSIPSPKTKQQKLPKPVPPEPSKSERWQSWVATQEQKGFKVLGAEQSQGYLEKHRIDKHSFMPNSFLSLKQVSFIILMQNSDYPPDLNQLGEYLRQVEARREKVQFDLITMDHNDNLRVVVLSDNSRLLPVGEWESWVTSWENRGYKVLTVEQSQQWLKARPGMRIGNIGFLAMIVTAESAVITADHNGDIRIVIKR